MLGNIGGRLTPHYTKDFWESWYIKSSYVHRGENKVRFRADAPLKQTDIDWIMNVYKTRMNFIIDNLIETRKEKLTDAAEVRTFLEEGNSCYGKQALKLGLIDRIAGPDEFFQDHFGGEKYTIGEPKIPLLVKLGFENGLFGSRTEVSGLFDDLNDKLSIED